jgi:hypothetical protein
MRRFHYSHELKKTGELRSKSISGFARHPGRLFGRGFLKGLWVHVGVRVPVNSGAMHKEGVQEGLGGVIPGLNQE